MGLLQMMCMKKIHKITENMLALPCENWPWNSEATCDLVNKLKQAASSLGLKLSGALQYATASLCLNHKKEVYLLIAEKTTFL